MYSLYIKKTKIEAPWRVFSRSTVVLFTVCGTRHGRNHTEAPYGFPVKPERGRTRRTMAGCYSVHHSGYLSASDYCTVDTGTNAIAASPTTECEVPGSPAVAGVRIESIGA
jgi:hypothetical protein